MKNFFYHTIVASLLLLGAELYAAPLFRCEVLNVAGDERLKEVLHFNLEDDPEELCQEATSAQLNLCFGPEHGNFALLPQAQSADSVSSNISFGDSKAYPKKFQLNLLYSKEGRERVALAQCQQLPTASAEF